MLYRIYNPVSQRLRRATPGERCAYAAYTKNHGSDLANAPLETYGEEIHIVGYNGLVCLIDVRERDNVLDISYFFIGSIRVMINNEWHAAKPYQEKLYIDFMWYKHESESKEYTITRAGTKASIVNKYGILTIKREGGRMAYLIETFENTNK